MEHVHFKKECKDRRIMRIIKTQRIYFSLNKFMKIVEKKPTSNFE